MSNLRYKRIYYISYSVLTCATIAFTIHGLSKYYLNEDISQVTFQEFHKAEENAYPSLAICASSTFDNNLLELHGEGINTTTYSSYLEGEDWDDRMMDIDYDNVTLNFQDYFLGASLWTPDWKHLNGEERYFFDHRTRMMAKKGEINVSETSENEWRPHHYTSYRGHTQKCFSVEIPYMPNEKVLTFGIVFDSYLFPDGIRPDYLEFGVKMHYPGQFLSSKVQKFIWKSRDGNSSAYLTMRFRVQKLEVIRHRENGRHSCNKNWQNYDEEIMLEKIKNVGCKPSHWVISTNAPPCQTQEQIKSFSQFNTTNFRVACQSIQKILYNYEEYEILEDATDEWINKIDEMFEVMIEFQDDTYMEVRQLRDYGIQSVIGEIGGVAGLFLGFTLLQIPEIIFNLCLYTKNVIAKWNGFF